MDETELPRLLFEAGIATREQADKLEVLIAEEVAKEGWIRPDGTMTG